MMKKDMEWLVQKINAERENLRQRFESGRETADENAFNDGRDRALLFVLRLIDQLDEPEVLSQEENVNIVLDDLKEHIKEQQALAQNVGLAHTSAGNDIHYRQYDFVLECIDEYEPSDELQKLLVPKQEEITEKQAWEKIHETYTHDLMLKTHKYLLELNGYVVIEKPIIPQFVADWHKQNKYYLLSAKFERIADWEDERVVNWYEKCTGRHSNNLANAQETIALMDLVGYEVEEEPLYYALIKGHELVDSHDIYWHYDKSGCGVFISGLHPPHDNFLTEMSKSEWDKLGINDSNADFIKAVQE